MICPRCGSRMVVTNTYACGEAGSFQSIKCTGCKARGVSQTVLVTLDPAWGDGAAARARKSIQGEGQTAHETHVGIKDEV